MKAVATVVGKDRVGIIAGVCALLSEKDINILDISQTVMDEYFTMIMLIDTDGCALDFDVLCSHMDAKGREMNLSIRIMREDIFEAMHRI